MFRKDDIVIEFLEETREIKIPIEFLEDETQTIQIIEENFDTKIPEGCEKKKEIEKHLKNSNEEYQKFLKKKRPMLWARNMIFMVLFLLPLLILGWFITKNTSLVFLRQMHSYILLMIISSWMIIIALSIVLIIPKIKKKSWKVKHSTMVAFGTFVIYAIGVFTLTDLLYGKDKKYQDFIIRESMNTKDHQFIASIFYNHRTIENTLSKTKNQESGEELYQFEPINFETKFYANSYEKELFTKEDENQIYKIVKVEGVSETGGYKYSGFLTVVYDPSHVKIGTSVGAGTGEGSYGQTLSDISKENHALVAMNAGGFYDPDWSSNGGIPHGTVIQNGVVKTEYNRGIDSGGMIGFNQDNQLILKRMSTSEAIQMGIRDAVDWGPFLIVNGENYFSNSTSKWACARSVIGQRKDGVVLMLVIDGDQPHSKGASYKDLADIMERYGAYNAATLDGGTSSSMVENHEYINIPFNGTRRTIRRLPNAWIVTE